MRYNKVITITVSEIAITRIPQNSTINKESAKRRVYLIDSIARFNRVYNIRFAIKGYHVKSTYYISAE